MLPQRLDVSAFCLISERIVIKFFEINSGGLKSLVIFVFSSLLESNFYGCLNVKIYILLTVLEFCFDFADRGDEHMSTFVTLCTQGSGCVTFYVIEYKQWFIYMSFRFRSALLVVN